MKIVVFGLSVSSSWGNGHAPLWRALIRALLAQQHRVVFFERDVPYYAEHRDVTELPSGGLLILYSSWAEAQQRMRSELCGADVGVVTSYCPDARAATNLLTEGRVGLRCFYDLDTPVTLGRLTAGEDVEYVGEAGFAPFDLVLSYTGGAALTTLRETLGARTAAPLYGSVDPEIHRPTSPRAEYASSLSYLGTYAADRQHMLERLLINPAKALSNERFRVAGAQYPADFPWLENIFYRSHLPPAEHAVFYCSSRLTLNVTRGAMARMGWCPSGRLFEAAACGCPILSDWFDGLDMFFTPKEEIIVAHDTQDAIDAIRLDAASLAEMAQHARERTLDEHTAPRRAAQMIDAFERAACGTPF